MRHNTGKIRIAALCVFMGVSCLLSAQTWTQSNGSAWPWKYIASSADGTKAWAVLTNAIVLVSVNSGMNWGLPAKQPSGIDYTTCVACSADGTNVIVAGGRNALYKNICTSTNFGATWVTNAVPRASWTSVASSADGSTLLAASVANGIYISTNMGGVWNRANITPIVNWNSVSCSADGTLLAATSTNGLICISTNAGITWFTNSAVNVNSGFALQKAVSGVSPKVTGSLANSNWQAVACSADKTRLAAIVYGGPICLSMDSGATWSASTAPNTNWQAITCSADGSMLAAAVDNGPIYTSSDFGATWKANNVPNTNWTSLVSSADGCKLTAVYVFSRAYNLQITPHPALRLSMASSNLAFSWVKPSTNFVLQQSADLSSWSGITNPPALNLSNLQFQVNLPPSNSSAFYRLIQQ